MSSEKRDGVTEATACGLRNASLMERTDACDASHESPGLVQVAGALALLRARWTPMPMRSEAGRSTVELQQRIEVCREQLMRDGGTANTRALLAIQTLPDTLFDLVVARVGYGRRTRGALCAAAVYAALMQLTHHHRSCLQQLLTMSSTTTTREEEERTKKRAITAETATVRQLSEAIAFMEEQPEIMGCVEAHGLAQTIAAPFEEHGVVLVHRMCGCGGCGFRVTVAP